MHGEEKIISDKMREIVDYSKTKGYELIIAADVNAHSTVWEQDLRKKCKRGEELEQYIVEENLRFII